ncbi:hypothetical protein [Sphingomonas rhizophila]|uniref:hypothetical protein n=1 Tax=Sphingomonas rhizophila TaxID=2071607 RepID=UPI001FEAA9BD|nr:hypothetical protein [Sphingomonas rhizophila]
MGPRASSDQADEEVVGVGGEHDRIGGGTAKLRRHRSLRGGPDLAHHPVPFAVSEARSVVPAFDLAIEAGVGPQMVTVGGEVQPFRRCAERAREEPLEAHNSVRSDQSSGKARLDKVDAR